MTTTRFAPGAVTAYVTDHVIALGDGSGVDADVMARCAAAAEWGPLAAAAAELGLAAVVMHDPDRIHVAVSGSAVVTVDGPHGERRFEGTEGWTTDVVEHPHAVTIRSSAGDAPTEHMVYCVDGGAVPASSVVRRLAAAPSPAADPFEVLFGHTVPRSVEAAAVRPAEASRSRDAVLCVLVFTTGDRVVVDAPVVIGRNPRAADGPGGQDEPSDRTPRLVKVAHPGVSRRHAAIRLDRWSATIDDLGSANGTTVTMPGRAAVALHPGTPVDLIIGAVVDLGGSVSFTVEEAA